MMNLRAARGFTLIELLAVIAMILILAALILPWLARTRETRCGAGCAHNLSQIGKAMYIYSMTYHCYPTTASGQDPFAVNGSALQSLNLLYRGYMTDVRVFRCPSDRTTPSLAGIVPTKDGKLQDGGAGMVSSYSYDPGHDPEDDFQASVAIAADRKGKWRNSVNHAPNTGQNVLIGQGGVEWRDNCINVLGKIEGVGRTDDDIFSLNPELPRKLDSYIRQ